MTGPTDCSAFSLLMAWGPTVSTGQGALRSTASVVESKTMRSRPCSALVPIMARSIFFAEMVCRMVAVGFPLPRMASHCTPACTAWLRSSWSEAWHLS